MPLRHWNRSSVFSATYPKWMRTASRKQSMREMVLCRKKLMYCRFQNKVLNRRVVNLTNNYIKSSNIWFDGVHRKRCTSRTYSRIGDLESKHGYVLKKFEICSREIGGLKGMVNQLDIK
jgi:hypothetical protein